MAIPVSAVCRHDNDFGRRRDAQVCWLLSQHPATASMLVSLGWFPTAAKARRRLRRLALKNRIRLVGAVARKAGRPEFVWCGWRPPVTWLSHEVELTELALRLHVEAIRRGPQVQDQQLRPDAEVVIDGTLYYLELDRGTSAYDRIVNRRFALYRTRPAMSLWVCPSMPRRDGLRRRAESLRSTALFTTFAEVLAAPHGLVWIDHDGQRAALPRQQDTGGGSSIPGPKVGPKGG